ATDIDRQLATIDGQLAREFPRYPSLANPRPLSIAETQKLLLPNEALLFFTFETKDINNPERQSAYAWAITKNRTRFEKLALTKTQAADMVQALRCGLDYSEWDSLKGQLHCNQLLGVGVPDEDRRDPLPFSFAIAHDLYTSLFGPFKELIGDRQLLVVPSGPLAALPLHVLVTEPPGVSVGQKLDDYPAIKWLANHAGATVLPSVSSLRALRVLTRRSNRAADPYVGYGAPALQGNDRCVAGVQL